MKAKTRIQMLRIWLAAIMIAMPMVVLAEGRSEAGSIVVQDENTTAAQLSSAESEAARKAARRTLRGYRGFVELGGFFNIGNDIGKLFPNSAHPETTRSTLGSKIGLSTSHGYQFNNFFFLGAGMTFDAYTKEGNINIPIFADARVNLLNRKISPTIGMRLGGAIGSLGGLYLSFSAGCRIALSHESAINCCIEYVMQNNMNDIFIAERSHIRSLGLKIGYEF